MVSWWTNQIKLPQSNRSQRWETRHRLKVHWWWGTSKLATIARVQLIVWARIWGLPRRRSCSFPGRNKLKRSLPVYHWKLSKWIEMAFKCKPRKRMARIKKEQFTFDAIPRSKRKPRKWCRTPNNPHNHNSIIYHLMLFKHNQSVIMSSSDSRAGCQRQRIQVWRVEVSMEQVNPKVTMSLPPITSRASLKMLPSMSRIDVLLKRRLHKMRWNQRAVLELTVAGLVELNALGRLGAITMCIG